MTPQTLQQAIEEAERFIRCARILQQKVDEDPRWGYATHRAASGAVRRASMDLTRSLSQLRKPTFQ